MIQILQSFVLLLITIAGSLVISFLFSWPIYMLWNGCLVGAITGVNPVSWLQAWGLAVLCYCLFGQRTSKSKAD